ncbi:MAG: YhbY family RNA-binding protein [Luminiphilus sp.]|nr:YhbY family RNA-binding protein [Luminiphilus sp.]
MQTRLLKQYRAIAHKLNPIVTIGANGITDNIKLELDRALRDHELVKIKVNIGDRDERSAAINELAAHCAAEIVQTIGRTATLLRPTDNPDPRKSNLQRPL